MFTEKNDLTVLVVAVAEADELMAEAHKKTDEALAYWITKILPWRRRKLLKAKADLLEQTGNLRIAKQYIDSVVSGTPIDI